MAIQAYTESSREYNLDQRGFGLDVRPGVNASNWDATNAYFWPKDERGISSVTLLPAALDPAWGTTATPTGIFSRTYLGQVSLDHSNTWEEYDKDLVNNRVLLSKGVGNGMTLPAIEAGAGIVINFHMFGPHLSNQTMLSVTFGAPDANLPLTSQKAFTLNLREDGRAFLSRGVSPVVPLAEGWLVPNRWGSLLGTWQKIFIRPFGHNRIQFSSSAGGSFVYEDTSLPRSTPAGGPTATLTAAGPVYINNPYGKVAIQPNPIFYHSSGQIVERDNPDFETEQDGRSIVVPAPKVYGDHQGLLSILATIAALAIQKSGRYGGRLTVSFTRPDGTPADQQKTPELYRVESYVPPIVNRKPDRKTDIYPDVTEFEHHQEKGGVTGNFILRHAQDHQSLKTAFNVPFSWVEDGNEWFKGVCLNPRWKQDGAEGSYIHMGLVDGKHYLSTKQIANQKRFDGLGIDDAVAQTLITLGFPADGSLWDIDPTPFVIDKSAGAMTPGVKKKRDRLSKAEVDDEPTNLVDAIKDGWEWLEYLIHTYTSAESFPFEWVMGFRPYLEKTGHWKQRFYFKDPDQMSTVPKKVFYPTQAIAVKAGADFNQAYQDIHQNWDLETIPPEFNDLTVIGMDANGKPLKSVHIYDKLAQNATLSFAQRPKNWVGEKWDVYYIDAALNTTAMQTQAAVKLAKKGFVARQRATFEAMWEPTLRLWDSVELWWLDSPDDLKNIHKGIFRITGFPVRHERNHDPQVRTVTYQCEREYV